MNNDIKKIQEANLHGKTVLLRVDLNLPIDDHGNILDLNRVIKIIPTIEYLTKQNAKIILISHLGRPEKDSKSKLSLKQLVPILEEQFRKEIIFYFDYTEALAAASTPVVDKIILLENLRFHPEEEANDERLADLLSKLADIYVNDAFACSHREHASIVAITKFLPSYAGLLFQQELSALEMVLKGANHPVIAILGGKKVSTKYKLIQNIADKVDYIILGGAMANTALASLGYDMGKSYVEYEFLDEVKDLVQKIGLQKLRLPNDFIVQNIGAIEARNLDSLKKEDMIGDIGPKTVIQWNNLINQCKTLVWNGPMGIYETPQFNKASEDMADYISNRTNNGKLFSLVGGGDLVAVIRKMGSEQNFSYVSTAGGAFLSLLSGEDLPGIQSLKRALN